MKAERVLESAGGTQRTSTKSGCRSFWPMVGEDNVIWGSGLSAPGRNLAGVAEVD